MIETQALGFAGEAAVAEYLVGQGFTVVSQNFRCRFGEIDLIVSRGEILAFVEVKTRKVCHFPIASVVTPSKQYKIIKTAKLFLQKHSIENMACRFDVATVVWCDASDGSHEIEYIENAFYGR